MVCLSSLRSLVDLAGEISADAGQAGQVIAALHQQIGDLIEDGGDVGVMDWHTLSVAAASFGRVRSFLRHGGK